MDEALMERCKMTAGAVLGMALDEPSADVLDGAARILYRLAITQRGRRPPSINIRDSSLFLVCVGCWKRLPRTALGSGAMVGDAVICCERTYQSVSVRSSPEEFSQAYILVADADGPIGPDGT